MQIFAISLFLFSLAMESLSDMQLKDFLKNRDSKASSVCDKGLWKYSRHPNYFFEAMIWLSVGIFSFEAQYGYLGIIPFIIMYLLITKVTGIPPLEKSSLSSKGDAYKEYQEKTNKFIPWFPKALVIIVSIIFSLLGDRVMATSNIEINQSQVNKIEKVFNELRADNLKILDNFYDKNIHFLDPLGEHKGIDAVKSYYHRLYKNVQSIRFDFTQTVSQGNHHVVVWIMYLKAPALNSGKEITLHGNSMIKFNESNKVHYHRDYFDMGEFVYEGVPVLGSIIRMIKNKMKGQ